MSGLGWGWTPPTLMKLQNSESGVMMTYEQVSWIASIAEVGRVAGPLIAPFILDRIGRKYAVFLSASFYLLLWPMLFFLRDFYPILLARLIFGMTDGFYDAVAPIYIAENCCTKIREIIGCAINILYQAGFFKELIIATYLSYDNTIIVNGIISVCAYATLCFCIETPSFSIMKNKCDDAKKNLQWLNVGLSQDQLAHELEKLEMTVREEKEKRKTWKTLLTSRENATSLFIVLSMFVIISTTGSSAINPHATLIFSSTETIRSNHFAILYGLGIFLSTYIVFFVASNINRRTLFMTCFSITALCHVVMVGLIYLRSRNYELLFHPWLIFFVILIFGTTRAMYAPAQFVLRAELLPLSVRAIGGSWAILLSSLTAFCTSKLFMPITKHLGMEINFLVYAVVSVLMIFMVYYHLPETRGKSLDEIQNELKNPTKSHNCKNESIEITKV